MGAGQDHRRRARAAARPRVQRLSPTSRQVAVAAERVPGWCERFVARHGDTATEVRENCLWLTAADGSTARLCPPFPDQARLGASDLSARVLAPRRTAVLLVRRGGYACAVVHGDAVMASKVGRRYVQSRTAAGGWSQQRFARRRDNQARDLTDAAADVAARLLVTDHSVTALVTGGDTALVEAVLADRRLARLAELTRGAHLEVPDPGRELVAGLPARLRTVQVTVVDVTR